MKARDALHITYLRLGELKRFAELQPLGDAQVLVPLELCLQGLDLGGGESGARSLLSLVVAGRARAPLR
jgi:hypothetical protein